MYGDNMWESSLMGHLAVSRAHYIGKVDTVLGLKKRAKKEPDKLMDELKNA